MQSKTEKMFEKWNEEIGKESKMQGLYLVWMLMPEKYLDEMRQQEKVFLYLYVMEFIHLKVDKNKTLTIDFIFFNLANSMIIKYLLLL